MNNHEYYMSKALDEAKKALEEGNPPFGCCLKIQNAIILSHNTSFTENDPTRHAELNAIRKLFAERKDDCLNSDITLYTTVQPCVMCLGAISWAGIKKIVYGSSIGFSKKNGFQEFSIPFDHLCGYMPYELEIVGGVFKNESEDLISRWNNKNKVLNWFNKKWGE